MFICYLNFFQALNVRESLFGDCAKVADTYHHLGNAHYLSNQYEKALIFYKESVRIRKKIRDNTVLYKVSFDMVRSPLQLIFLKRIIIM